MLSQACALVYVKDLRETGSTNFFLKDSAGFRAVEAKALREVRTPLVCHDFWLIKDELAHAGGLPEIIFDVDEVSSIVSQKRNLREQRDQQNISVKIPQAIISQEDLRAYGLVINRKSPIDYAVLELACDALVRYAQVLIDEAMDNDEFDRLMEVELPVLRMLAEHSSLGIAIDIQKLKAFRDLAQYEFYSALKLFAVEFDLQPEVMNDRQLRDYVAMKGLSDTEVSLEYIIEYIPIQGDFGQKLQELRKLRDTNSILNELSLSQGDVHPIVDVFGTRTSRVIYRNPSLQNLSKRFREVIVPRQGTKVGYVDYDQFEVGIMAALSNDANLKKLYDAGDMYDLFAKDYLALENFRKQAKQLFLSYAYGMSTKAVIDAAVELGASRERAKTAFRSFSEFENWKKQQEDEFDRSGKVSTLLGNYIVGEGKAPFSRKEKRSMISQCIQGTGSLIFKRALLLLAECKDCRVLLPMHDAVLFEYIEDETPEFVVKSLQDAMTLVLGNKIQGKASVDEFYPVMLNSPVAGYV